MLNFNFSRTTMISSSAGGQINLYFNVQRGISLSMLFIELKLDSKIKE